MGRRTVNLPEGVEGLVRELASEGESFSAAVARLIEAGAKGAEGEGTSRRPGYVASGEGPDDLGRRAEHYLRDLATSR